MSSIALFPCMPTLDSGIIGQLSRISTLRIYTDENLFGDTVAQFGGTVQRLRKIMYGKTSIFNQFTLNKEKVVNTFQQILTDKLCEPEHYLFHGFLTSLMPSHHREILRVVVVDTRDNRIECGMREGLAKTEAKKNIHNHDASAFRWTKFLFNKDWNDSSLYDLVVPVKKRNHRQITKEILSYFHQTSVLRTTETKKAVHALRG